MSDHNTSSFEAERRGTASAETGQSGSTALPVNGEIATRLEEVAQLLADQGANPYRVGAYRSAAHTVREWPRSVAELASKHGIGALMELPGIGDRLAQAIYQLARSGRLAMLERLRGESDPEELLGSVIGIGPGTARRIHDELGVHTLEELEMAAHDGRLEALGIGPKRLAGIRDALASRLGRIGRRGAVGQSPPPDVAEVLDVDQEYRERVERNSLPKIAPRRFNLGGVRTAADIVVVGAVARAPLRRILLDHTAERVLDALDCDVLIVTPSGFRPPVTRHSTNLVERSAARYVL